MKKTDKRALIKQARIEYGDSCTQIDDNARISGHEKAAWVSAWVWVELNETEELDNGLHSKTKNAE